MRLLDSVSSLPVNIVSLCARMDEETCFYCFYSVKHFVLHRLCQSHLQKSKPSFHTQTSYTHYSSLHWTTVTPSSLASASRLHLAQNTAARLLLPGFASLHWLPVRFRIDFKMLLIPLEARRATSQRCWPLRCLQQPQILRSSPACCSKVEVGTANLRR